MASPTLATLKVKLFTDGADKSQIVDMAAKPWIAGFTTNPSLLKKAGVDGDMDTLRVLAFLERFGEADPLGDLGNGGGGPGGPGGPGPGGNGGGTPCRRPILSGGCEIRTREGSRHAFQFCCWPFVGSPSAVGMVGLLRQRGWRAGNSLGRWIFPAIRVAHQDTVIRTVVPPIARRRGRPLPP